MIKIKVNFDDDETIELSSEDNEFSELLCHIIRMHYSRFNEDFMYGRIGAEVANLLCEDNENYSGVAREAKLALDLEPEISNALAADTPTP